MDALLNIGFYLLVAALSTAGAVLALFFTATIYVYLRIRHIKEVDKQMVVSRWERYIKDGKNYFKLTPQ